VISRAALPPPNVRSIPILPERGVQRDGFVLRCLLPLRGNIFLEPSASSYASTPPKTRGFARFRDVFGFRADVSLRPYPDNSPASSAIEFGEDANQAELGGDAAQDGRKGACVTQSSAP